MTSIFSSHLQQLSQIQTVNEFEKIQKPFCWNNSPLKIKHETFSNNYKAERLKNVDILNKIIAIDQKIIAIDKFIAHG